MIASGAKFDYRTAVVAMFQALAGLIVFTFAAMGDTVAS
jgi:hypothetical protein